MNEDGGEGGEDDDEGDEDGKDGDQGDEDGDEGNEDDEGANVISSICESLPGTQRTATFCWRCWRRGWVTTRTSFHGRSPERGFSPSSPSNQGT